MTITVSEDLNASPRDQYRFCAIVIGDTDPERGGFGATERAALVMLARMSGDCASHFLKNVTIERISVR